MMHDLKESEDLLDSHTLPSGLGAYLPACIFLSALLRIFNK